MFKILHKEHETATGRSNRFEADKSLYGRSWALGAEAVRRAQVIAGENTPHEALLRSIGVFACTEGLCEGICVRSLAEIRQDWGLDRDGADLFIGGAQAALKEITPETGAAE